jgi:hypothetical protein
MTTTRVALVKSTDVEAIARYLPSNYTVRSSDELGTVIAGTDSAGWTLDGYVLPRLASGLYFGTEITEKS